MKFSFLRLALVTALVFSLAACTNTVRRGTEVRDGVRDGVRQNQVRTDYVRPLGSQGMNEFNDGRANVLGTRDHTMDGRSHLNASPMHNNTRMEMSREIAEKIAAMREVRTANVLLTNHNAYVAVELEDFPNQHRTHTNRTHTNGVNTNRTHLNGTHTSGAGTHLNGMHTPNAVDRNISGNRAMRDGHMHGTSAEDLSVTLKDRIANEVKALHPTIEHVYVTASPDFVARMNGYAQSVEQGRPLSGLIIEFNRIVENLFPTSAGTDNITGPMGTTGTNGTTRTTPGVNGTNVR